MDQFLWPPGFIWEKEINTQGRLTNWAQKRSNCPRGPRGSIRNHYFHGARELNWTAVNLQRGEAEPPPTIQSSPSSQLTQFTLSEIHRSRNVLGIYIRTWGPHGVPDFFTRPSSREKIWGPMGPSSFFGFCPRFFFRLLAPLLFKDFGQTLILNTFCDGQPRYILKAALCRNTSY